MPILLIELSLLNSKLAYLDPGSGSYLLQIILASILGGFFAIKLYWKKITGLFHRSNSNKHNIEQSTNENDDTKQS